MGYKGEEVLRGKIATLTVLSHGLYPSASSRPFTPQNPPHVDYREVYPAGWLVFFVGDSYVCVHAVTFTAAAADLRSVFSGESKVRGGEEKEKPDGARISTARETPSTALRFRHTRVSLLSFSLLFLLFGFPSARFYSSFLADYEKSLLFTAGLFRHCRLRVPCISPPGLRSWRVR